jgi:hypothetical protein
MPGGGASRLVPEGFKLPPGTEALGVMSNTVSEGYFDTLNVPIVHGRGFQQTDRAESRPVAIVNELFARKYYPNQNPIGKRLRVKGAKDDVLEIVGVARQSKYEDLVEPPIEYLYRTLSQNPQQAMTIMVATAGPSSGAAGPLRDIVRSLDAGQPMYGVRTMEEVFDERANELGIWTEAIGAMGLLGLILAMVGLYGLMSYSVSLRAREIGIRNGDRRRPLRSAGHDHEAGNGAGGRRSIGRSAALPVGQQGGHLRAGRAVVQFAFCGAGDSRAGGRGGAGRICPGAARIASRPECRAAAGVGLRRTISIGGADPRSATRSARVPRTRCG